MRVAPARDAVSHARGAAMNGDELSYDDVRLIARILQSARPGAVLAFRHGDVEVELTRSDAAPSSVAGPVPVDPDAQCGR